VFHLPHIHVRKTKKVSISVLHAQIPGSYYNINNSNNILVYSIDDGSLPGEPVKKTVQMQPSNYNINTLITHIESLLEVEFDITYSASSNKLTITHSTFDFELDDSSTCFELLGFSSVDHESTSQTLTSDNVVNLFNIRTLHICSDNFILNNIDSFNPNNSNILASIPITSSFNSIISYSNPHDVHSEINNTRNLTNLHIKITDQDSNVIELNNAHWSITLLLSIK
jgi:hypothetical protein